jgi:hypothetical protein
MSIGGSSIPFRWRLRLPLSPFFERPDPTTSHPNPVDTAPFPLPLFFPKTPRRIPTVKCAGPSGRIRRTVPLAWDKLVGQLGTGGREFRIS